MKARDLVDGLGRMPLWLYLIRHGGTAWSISGQHTGRTDIPLTPRGESEATRLKHRLDNIGFAHVLTSPSRRARRTCELVDLERAAEIDPDLAEWDYGQYEGRRSVDIRAERPGWNVFRDGCPGGETPAQVSDRADRLIVRLRSLDGTVALFSHGQFGSVLAARWIGLPLIEAQHLRLDTASLSILGSDPPPPRCPSSRRGTRPGKRQSARQASRASAARPRSSKGPLTDGRTREGSRGQRSTRDDARWRPVHSTRA
jgi:broad specificity phosphatase PhoE